MSDIDVTAGIADRGRDLRIQGQIIPPVGTTVGNVLTATALGSSWQAAGGAAGGFATISDQTLGADAANIDFSGIPSTYMHILFTASLRDDRGGIAIDDVGIRFNNDSGANYAYARAGTFTDRFTGVTAANIGLCTAATANANEYGQLFCLIPFYTGTAHFKSGWCVGGQGGSAAVGSVETHMWTWSNTSAINRLTILPTGGGTNFKASSRVILYGWPIT